MAEANEKNVANAAVPHDRVAMLSLKADGTPDQTNPEMIGDKEFSIEATKRQFAEHAVSAADDAKRATDRAEAAAALKQDPSIAAAQKEHDAIKVAAEKSAVETVERLS